MKNQGNENNDWNNDPDRNKYNKSIEPLSKYLDLHSN
jgi:hypothetical protein